MNNATGTIDMTGIALSPIGTEERPWIELFNLKETEETAKLWGQAVIRLGIGKRKYKSSPEREKDMNDMIFFLLYLPYDIEKEFLTNIFNACFWA